MTTIKIFLDDVRETPEGYVSARSVEELKLYYKIFNEEIEEISLDHDLGDNVPTGYDFLKWFEEELYLGNITNVPLFRIHSDNGPGRVNMARAISSIERIKIAQTT